MEEIWDMGIGGSVRAGFSVPGGSGSCVFCSYPLFVLAED